MIGFGIDYSGAKIHQSTQKEGMEQPVWHWVPSIAPSGMAFYTGDLFPAWRGNLFVGALKAQLLVRLELDGQKVVKEERLFRGLNERIRDVRQGPDGALWLATDNPPAGFSASRPRSERTRGPPGRRIIAVNRVLLRGNRTVRPWFCRPCRHSADTKPLYPPAPDPINRNQGRPADAVSGHGPFRACVMFTLFERLLKPTDNPERPEPPAGLIAFFWHYARQAKGLFIALFVVGFVVALLDTMIPIFIGRVVTLVTTSRPETLFADNWPHAARHGARLAGVAADRADRCRICHQPGDHRQRSNRIRWQNHWHVVRQSWAFFQNDFAGRIANRVMQTGPAMRESVVALITARLVHPRLWRQRADAARLRRSLAGDAGGAVVRRLSWLLLRYFVPRMRDRSKEMSEARSMLTGRIVDSYTNILTVKLFARAARGRRLCARRGRRPHRQFHAQLRLNTLFGLCLSSLNAMLVTGTAGIAICAVERGHIAVGTVAMALPLAWQIVSVAGWVALEGHYHLREYRRGAGRHDDDRACRSRSPTGRTRRRSQVTRGEIAFEEVRFGYGRQGASSTASPRRCGRARRSGWSAVPAPASRRSSTCCCASSTSKAAAS